MTTSSTFEGERVNVGISACDLIIFVKAINTFYVICPCSLDLNYCNPNIVKLNFLSSIALTIIVLTVVVLPVQQTHYWPS